MFWILTLLPAMANTYFKIWIFTKMSEVINHRQKDRSQGEKKISIMECLFEWTEYSLQLESSDNISYRNSSLGQMTGNIYSFSRGRILPQIKAWTDSLYCRSPRLGNLLSKLSLTCTVKIYLIGSCIWMLPNLQYQLILHEVDHFSLMRKLYSLKNSSKSKDFQNSHTAGETRNWMGNYHGLILQSCMKKGILMCCTGLCMSSLSVVSQYLICADDVWFPKWGNHTLETLGLYSLTLVPRWSSCISKDITKTSSKNQPIEV